MRSECSNCGMVREYSGDSTTCVKCGADWLCEFTCRLQGECRQPAGCLVETADGEKFDICGQHAFRLQQSLSPGYIKVIVEY